jgi:hypothetical protein
VRNDLDGPSDPGCWQFLIAQAPIPPHEGARRGTEGFSSEKITEVLNGYV